MTAVPALLTALAVGAAVLLGSGAGRVRPDREPASGAGEVARAERAVLLRLRPLLTGFSLIGGWVLLGGVVGVVAGLGAAWMSWTILGNAEDPETRRRKLRLERDLPTGVDLLGSCLAAGGAVAPTLLVVADALGGPVAEEFRRIHHRLCLGVDPLTVWRDVAQHPQLGSLGRALARAHESGASITGAVHRLADELRARARAEVEVRAKSVEVKAAAPLGVCFLPAFMLLGVVPLVAGIFTSMDVFG